MAERRTTLRPPRTRRRSASKRRLGRSSLVVQNDQNDVSCLLLRLDVLGRLDDVLQRIATIDDGPELTGFDEVLEEDDVLLGRHRAGYREPHSLASGQRCPPHQD